MNRTKFRPTYSLDEAKSLARSGEMVVNGRVRRHLINQFGYLDIDRFLADLFDCLKPGDFRKSIALDMDGPLHDVYADVYVVGILNVRIGTLSFQSILKARRI